MSAEILCAKAGCLNSHSGFGRSYCKDCYEKMNPGLCFYCKGRGTIMRGHDQSVADCGECNGTGKAAG